MRAIMIDPDDRSLRWSEVPDPVPGPGEVVVRVRACGVNRGDLLQRRGLYPPPAGAPEWMGLEAAGNIESAGAPLARIGRAAATPAWHPGDPVCCLLSGGGYAEKVAVDARHVLPIPAGLSIEEAAAIPEAFTTAFLNLVLEGRLARGETVVVHAGASGVGTAAIQIAKDRGARIVTTVGSEPKAERVRALGADVVIDRHREDVLERLRSLARPPAEAAPPPAAPAAPPAPGIDVVLDCLGGEDLGGMLTLLNPGGRWIVVGLMRGGEARIDLRPLLSRRLRIIGSVLRSRPAGEKAAILERMRRALWPRFEAGAIRPIVHAILPVERAEEAHAILQRNENVGKVLLRIDAER